jgi:DNA helicase II / ATP-dependent DNA helicase PcrA
MMINEAVAPGVEVIRLEENFRSFSEICAAANTLIEHNTDRIKKLTVSARGPGGGVALLKPAMNEGEEIARVASKVKELIDGGANANEIAILARTNALCAAYVKTLAACEIPVRKKAEAKQPKDWPVARALVELMVNPHNDTLAYFALVMMYASEGMTPQMARKEAHSNRRCAEQAGVSINDFKKIVHAQYLSQAVTELDEHSITAETQMLVSERIHELPAGATMLDLALAMNGRTEEHEEEGQGVNVTTMHSSKGREFDVVFIVGAEDEITPGRRKDANIHEERRLFYVSVTRAREKLFVAHALSRVHNYGRKEIEAHTRSRFCKEMGL